MLEDQAALGVVALILFAVLLTLGFMRANHIFSAVFRFFGRILKTKVAVVAAIFLMLSLLIYGVANFGLVNSLPNEDRKAVERNRENNRMVVSQDKDGCMDMRTLGRSNGVYLSLKPCKPQGKDAEKKE